MMKTAKKLICALLTLTMLMGVCAFAAGIDLNSGEYVRDYSMGWKLDFEDGAANHSGKMTPKVGGNASGTVIDNDIDTANHSSKVLKLTGTANAQPQAGSEPLSEKTPAEIVVFSMDYAISNTDTSSGNFCNVVYLSDESYDKAMAGTITIEAERKWASSFKILAGGKLTINGTKETGITIQPNKYYNFKVINDTLKRQQHFYVDGVLVHSETRGDLRYARRFINDLGVGVKDHYIDNYTIETYCVPVVDWNVDTRYGWTEDFTSNKSFTKDGTGILEYVEPTGITGADGKAAKLQVGASTAQRMHTGSQKPFKKADVEGRVLETTVRMAYDSQAKTDGISVGMMAFKIVNSSNSGAWNTAFNVDCATGVVKAEGTVTAIKLEPNKFYTFRTLHDFTNNIITCYIENTKVFCGEWSSLKDVSEKNSYFNHSMSGTANETGAVYFDDATMKLYDKNTSITYNGIAVDTLDTANTYAIEDGASILEGTKVKFDIDYPEGCVPARGYEMTVTNNGIVTKGNSVTIMPGTNNLTFDFTKNGVSVLDAPKTATITGIKLGAKTLASADVLSPGFGTRYFSDTIDPEDTTAAPNNAEKMPNTSTKDEAKITELNGSTVGYKGETISNLYYTEWTVGNNIQEWNSTNGFFNSGPQFAMNGAGKSFGVKNSRFWEYKFDVKVIGDLTGTGILNTNTYGDNTEGTDNPKKHNQWNGLVIGANNLTERKIYLNSDKTWTDRTQTDVVWENPNEWNRFSVIADTEAMMAYYYMNDELIGIKPLADEIKYLNRGMSSVGGGGVMAADGKILYANNEINTFNAADVVTTFEAISGGNTITKYSEVGTDLKIKGWVPVGEIEDNEFYVVAGLFNLNGTADESDDRLADAAMAKVTKGADNSFEIDFGDLPTGVANGAYELRLFIWNGNLKPILSAAATDILTVE